MDKPGSCRAFYLVKPPSLIIGQEFTRILPRTGNAKRILAVASVLAICVLACGPGNNGIPAPPPPDQYRGSEEAQGHPCINQRTRIHDRFWELAYPSARQAVGSLYMDPTRDYEGNIVEV